jgi:predicted MFS family arabinose efflux permease
MRYAFGDENIRVLLIMLTACSMFGFGLLNLMPAWATHVLGGDVRTNGLLLSARGVGSLAGALMIATIGGRVIRGKIWTVGSVVMPISLILFSLFRNLPMSMIMLVGFGWSLMSVVNITNALIQIMYPMNCVAESWGYIFFYSRLARHRCPLAGGLAGSISEATTVLIFASIILIVALTIHLRQPSIRKYN